MEPARDDGLRLGRYETLFRIASGGMAEVHAARVRGEGGFEKLVAIKRMLPHLADDDRFVDMFLDEARIAANISSPHVVQTLDLGRADDGSLYIVMDLVVGVSLSALLRAETKAGRFVPVPIAVELLAQAAQGLDDAHEAVTPAGQRLELVHRDVSPQNILVGVDGRARVTDFGIARAMMRRTETRTGQMKGKFAYFSPEQASAKPVDRRTDVFALGIVAWELLTGRRLFDAENPIESIEKVKTMPIAPPHLLRPEVPQAVSRVVLAALARDVEERLQTAADFADGLRRAAREAGLDQPSARAIGRYVQESGGEQLARIQRRIDAAASGDAPAEASQPSRPSALGSGSDVAVAGRRLSAEAEPRSGVSAISARGVSAGAFAVPDLAVADAATRPGGGHDADELPTHARAVPPGAVAPAPPPSPARGRGPLPWVLLGGGALLLVGAGVAVAALLAAGPDDDAPAVSATGSVSPTGAPGAAASATPAVDPVPTEADSRPGASAGLPNAAQGPTPDPADGAYGRDPAGRGASRNVPGRGARGTGSAAEGPANLPAGPVERGVAAGAAAGAAGAAGSASGGASQGAAGAGSNRPSSAAGGPGTADPAPTARAGADAAGGSGIGTTSGDAAPRPTDRPSRGGGTASGAGSAGSGAAAGVGAGAAGRGGVGTQQRTGLLEW